MRRTLRVAVLSVAAALVAPLLAYAEDCTATNVVVAPLTDAHWTQGAPYNDYSPKGTIKFTSGWEAGCVAIAAAQELRHWRWPWRLEAVRETSHPVLNESPLALRFDGNVPFDWDDMPASFSSGGTLAQKHAAARLVLACQSLVQMQFVNAGGEAKKNLPGTMEWFEFAGQVDPKSGDAALAALRSDFEFGSPVQTGINFKGYGGHEVVGLGYATGTNSVGAAKNLIWLNLGWGGGSDGWYDLSETSASETVIKSVQLGFRPIKSVQIEPLAPISGSSATINWHLPDCYTNKISGFTVAKKKLGTSTTTWTDDFSTAKGRSNNANEVRIVNGALKAWDGTASGIYMWDEVFVPTADSILTYDVGSSYMSGMSVRFEAKVDGAWQTLQTVAVNGGKEYYYYQFGRTTPADPVSLASLAGKSVQIRFVVEYTSGGIYSSDDASVKIDNLSVSNVKTFSDVSSATLSASARTTTFSNLEQGEVYAFSVTPVMNDGSAAVTQTATTTIGSPAPAPVIGTVSMSPRGTDLMQDGFYSDIATGWNVIDVTCQNVETLEAFPSHQSVLPQSKVEVVNNGSGSFSVNIDASEVAAKWAGQRFILTLKATNATGATTYKDLELRLVASGVPVSLPGANIWTASGSDWYDTASCWSKNRVPDGTDPYVVFNRTGNTEVYITDNISLGNVAIEGVGSFKFVDFFYMGATVSIQSLATDALFTIDDAIADVGDIRPLTAISSGTLTVSSGKNVTVAAGKTWKATGGLFFKGNQTVTVNGALNGAITAEGTGTTLALKPGSTITAASLNIANNTISIEKSSSAAASVTVSGAATLTGATIAVNLTDEATDSIALMSAGSFTGVDSATLSGLDDYTLEVDDGTLYAKKAVAPEPASGPVPIAEWDGDFSSEAHGRFSANGCTITDWNQTHGENSSSVVIDRNNQGLFVDFTEGKGYVTVFVKYSDLNPSSSYKRVLFATTANSDYTRDRCGIRLLTNGQIQGLWNNSLTANNDADYGTATGAVPSSGAPVFVYDKGTSGTSVYVAGSGESLPDTALWNNAALKSGNIYGFAVGGMCRNASASGVEAAKGMTITGLAVFTNILTVAEMNDYLGPQEKTTATDYPVPYSWFSEYGVAAGDVEATALSPSLNGENAWWECYVLGLNPTNANDKFTAAIRMEGQTPVVEFSPTNEVLKASGAIRYVLQGKPALTNDWADCPSFEAPGDTNRFFKVKVEW